MLQDNLNEVKKRITEAAARAGRNPDEITLIAVSKTKPAEMVKEIYDAVFVNSEKIKCRRLQPNPPFFRMISTGI